MSTSLLVENMIAAAKRKGTEADIEAFSHDQVGGRLEKTDILLLGPQIRYLLQKYKTNFGNKIPVIQVIEISDYGLMRGEKILNEVCALYEKTRQ
jgi:PTS system cellobiose-specific IIB component